MPNEFDWRNPNFGVRLLGDDVTPQQRISTYVKKAPKRTLKRKPKTNYGLSKNDRYVWDKGMTFEEKAAYLARMGIIGGRKDWDMFLTDFDEYRSSAEDVMDYLRNASSHEQKYYGVYDDLHPSAKPVTAPVSTAPTPPSAPVQRPVARQARPRTGGYRPAPVVPQPTIEPEALVDRAPLDTTDTIRTEWRKWNPTTAMASYQADSGMHNAALAPQANVPLTGVQLHSEGGWLFPFII